MILKFCFTARAEKHVWILPHAISKGKNRPLKIRIPETVSCSRGSLLSTKNIAFWPAGRKGLLWAGGKPSRRRPAAGGRPLDRLECHWPSFLFHFDRVGVVSRWPLPHAQAESHRKYEDRILHLPRWPEPEMPEGPPCRFREPGSA